MGTSANDMACRIRCDLIKRVMWVAVVLVFLTPIQAFSSEPVALFPVKLVTAGQRLPGIAQGMTVLLREKIRLVPGLVLLPSETVRKTLLGPEWRGVDCSVPARGAKAGQMVAAKYVLVGKVSVQEAGIGMDLSVIDVTKAALHGKVDLSCSDGEILGLLSDTVLKVATLLEIVLDQGANEEIRRSPNISSDAFVSLCNALYEEDFERIEALEEVRKLDPGAPLLSRLIGETYHQPIGLLEQAVDAFEKATKRFPKDPMIHYRFGAVLRDKGDVTGAITHFSRALELKSDLYHARVDLGRLYFDQDWPQMAIPEMEKALAINPEDPEICYTLGVTYEKLRNHEMAGRYYERYIQVEKRPQEQDRVRKIMKRLQKKEVIKKKTKEEPLR